MSRMLAIARLNLVALSRDRGELISATVLPLLLTWVFSTAFGSAGAERAIMLPVADLDATSYSKTVVVGIDKSAAFDVEIVSEDGAEERVSQGDAPIAVIIEKGLGERIEEGETARVRVVRYPGAVNAQAAVTVVEGAVRRVDTNAVSARSAIALLAGMRGPAAVDTRAPAPRFSDLYATADGLWEPQPPVQVVGETVRRAQGAGVKGEVSSNVQYSIGFTVFFVFMVAMGSAGGVLEERELGTLRRLLAAPLRRGEILGGKVLGVAAVAAAQAALLVVVGALVFGVPWGEDPLAVGALLIALVFAATGLGVMISALVRTRSQMSALVPIVSTALAMLGGCYWDLEVTSPVMQQIARFTPTGWAVAGLKDVVARGAGVTDVLVPVALLLGFAIVTLAVGTTRLRLE